MKTMPLAIFAAVATGVAGAAVIIPRLAFQPERVPTEFNKLDTASFVADSDGSGGGAANTKLAGGMQVRQDAKIESKPPSTPPFFPVVSFSGHGDCSVSYFGKNSSYDVCEITKYDKYILVVDTFNGVSVRYYFGGQPESYQVSMVSLDFSDSKWEFDGEGSCTEDGKDKGYFTACSIKTNGIGRMVKSQPRRCNVYELDGGMCERTSQNAATTAKAFELTLYQYLPAANRPLVSMSGNQN